MSNVFVVIVAVLLIAWGVWRAANNQKVGAANLAAGEAFLAHNADKPGVVTTASGLQYLVLTQGEGTESPTAKSQVTVHYHGTLMDGTVFDSSVERRQSITFGLNQVIKGWTEGVQLMVVGDKYRFFIPAKLAYGSRNMGAIAANSVLIFEVELLAF
ncbi:putative FKBP-type peptidyl-prolyl cis-trans isomerase FkpA [Sinobacterium norvegicum]|uniref:Peptidyl-prolyl cis-trans isomerase n=1 Tax=Sinobacterium norvegicum TaxID=1641715 RepID=A0ABM9AEY6_9GAMM|nr:FKBP-type peptidyl-prolyl cis-trans isomerase [Sinobacterium norvegicum]CAH0991764.1 putative FKBP-type peptidyl-prolyl cis-trans isomerase FkpA [Sinobacterium norvegicum]